MGVDDDVGVVAHGVWDDREDGEQDCKLTFVTRQSPTFNVSPVIPATVDACKWGIEVTLYLDLGKWLFFIA